MRTHKWPWNVEIVWNTQLQYKWSSVSSLYQLHFTKAWVVLQFSSQILKILEHQKLLALRWDSKRWMRAPCFQPTWPWMHQQNQQHPTATHGGNGGHIWPWLLSDGWWHRLLGEVAQAAEATFRAQAQDLQAAGHLSQDQRMFCGNHRNVGTQ